MNVLNEAYHMRRPAVSVTAHRCTRSYPDDLSIFSYVTLLDGEGRNLSAKKFFLKSAIPRNVLRVRSREKLCPGNFLGRVPDDVPVRLVSFYYRAVHCRQDHADWSVCKCGPEPFFA